MTPEKHATHQLLERLLVGQGHAGNQCKVLVWSIGFTHVTVPWQISMRLTCYSQLTMSETGQRFEGELERAVDAVRLREYWCIDDRQIVKLARAQPGLEARRDQSFSLLRMCQRNVQICT